MVSLQGIGSALAFTLRIITTKRNENMHLSLIPRQDLSYGELQALEYWVGRVTWFTSSVTNNSHDDHYTHANKSIHLPPIPKCFKPKQIKAVH
jgi:hypothetical protein